MITIELEGALELEKKLAALQIKMARKIRARAVKAGARITLARAKAIAPVIIGGRMGDIIARALQIRTMKKPPRGAYGVRVQHSADANDELVHITRDGRRYYIPNAIEHGHAAPGRGGAGRGAAPKDVPPNPYMRPALAQTAHRAAQKMIDVALGEIKREWNR
jgi:hypothetical protein